MLRNVSGLGFHLRENIVDPTAQRAEDGGALSFVVQNERTWST